MGMIGLGRKGTQWARAFALHPSCEVVACADSDADNLSLFAERFGLEPSAVYDDFEKMLDEQRLDIVSPILPVQPNPEVVVRCARTPGLRAIACEKPIAAQLSEADDMVQACKQHGVHFAAGDACRNYAQINEARRLIDGGAIGDVKQIDLFESTAEISGGGCQGLSVVRFFAHDSPIESVTGWVAEDPFSDLDQSMGGVIHFSSGITCFCHNEKVAKRGVEVTGTEGSFRTDLYTWFELETLEEGSTKLVTSWEGGALGFVRPREG